MPYELEKPPLGLMERKYFEKIRVQEILAAMNRYIDANKKFPKAWKDELNDLLTRM